MRFRDAGISLEPRPIGACIDLALVLSGRRLGACLLIWATWSLPAMGAVWIAARSSEYGWFAAWVAIGLASAPMGLCLVAYASAVAFAEPGDIKRQTLQSIWTAWRVLLARIALRVLQWPLLLMGLLPGLLLIVSTSFLAESRVLKRFRHGRHDHKMREVVRQEYSDLVSRAALLGAFGLVLWFVLAITVDAASMLLFEFPLILGRIAEATRNPWGAFDPDTFFFGMFDALFHDPVILSTLTGTALAAYGLCRLAWFLSYVDLRIRRDCWDLEVALADETQRWEAAT
ncbi:MAG TPA: hypothetical protein VM165_21910 [Planctomycetaceae bacterium]|nr:hypothetical protein [Planctomycetaceae bacterium]